MEAKTLLLPIVAVLSLVILVSSVSAYVNVVSVEVDGTEVHSGESIDVSHLSGETVSVKVTFEALDNAEDVRVKAWLAGSSGVSASTDRFDVIAGKTYTRTFDVELPSKVDLSESHELEIIVEGKDADTLRNEVLAAESYDLTVQRESYELEVLDVVMDNTVLAGDELALTLVIKNRGSQFSDDTFVKVLIPALGVETKAYFGDLAPVDQSDPDKEDAAEKRMLVSIPSSAKPGIYTLEIEAYGDDASTAITRKIAVSGASQESIVVTPARSKTFAPGAVTEYSLTLVNSGDKVRVFELTAESPEGLSVMVEEPVVAIPAGSSKTVKVIVSASEAGLYDFAVSVTSDGDLVKKESFVANAEGAKSNGTSGVAQNTTVLLTVVLAIIFVVLLVVLIVLLTRKPEKGKEFGESYY